MDLSEIRQLAAQGQLELARQRFRDLAEKHLASQGGHRELGLVAEQLGLLGLAEREFNLALRDDPADTEALRHLVDLAEERGHVERAVNLLVRLMDLAPEPSIAVKLYDLYLELGAEPKAQALAERCAELGIRLPRRAAEPPTPQEAEPVIPPDADLVRFLSLFGGREDVYARQWFSPAKGEGGYSPVREPLTPRQLRAHLLGEVTLGVYPIRLDGTCLFCALDLDLKKASLEEARRRQELARVLKDELARVTQRIRSAFEAEGLVPLVEDSGYKGRHFWFPLAAPEPAETLVALGKAVLAFVQPLLGEHLACEWFPKASKPGTRGLGNLIKLPLGVHRRTGRRSFFLDSEGRSIPNPWEFLRSAPLLDRQAILAFLDRRRVAMQTSEPVPEEGEAPTPEKVSLPPPPSWTANDFETHPDFRRLLGGCAVLRRLVTQAIEERRLSYHEATILVHTFGYVPNGVAAANYLFALVGTVPSHVYLKSPLRGNPVSCVKIRARIPEVTSRVPCNCVFPDVQDLYPTPLLHLRGQASEEDVAPNPSSIHELVRKAQTIQNRIAVWQADLAALRQAIIAAVKQEPQPYLDLGDCTVRVDTRDGVDTLIIEAKPQRP